MTDQAKHDRHFQTYASWRRAVRTIEPGAFIDGGPDIACAPGIGDWDGAEGVIYADAVTPAPRYLIHIGDPAEGVANRAINPAHLYAQLHTIVGNAFAGVARGTDEARSLRLTVQAVTPKP